MTSQHKESSTLVALALAGVCLAACGGVAREDFDAKFVEALCERYTSCGTSYDQATCEYGLQRSYSAPLGLDARMSGTCTSRMRYDEDAAEKCLDKIRDAPCSQDPIPAHMFDEGLGMSADCRFFFGTVADGEVCQWWSGECGAQSACVHHVFDPSPTTCQPLSGEGPTSHGYCAEGLVLNNGSCQKPVEQGQSCAFQSGLYEICAPGLYCAQDTRVCQKPSSQGEPCDEENRLCAWNLQCVNGTCKALGGKGAACTAPSQSDEPDPCQQGLFCDAEPGSPGTCHVPLAEGANCRDGRECRHGSWCDPGTSPSGSGGTCTRLAQQGEACADRRCDSLLYCSASSGTCKPRGHAGEPCEDSPGACFITLACTEGICGGPSTTASCP